MQTRLLLPALTAVLLTSATTALAQASNSSSRPASVASASSSTANAPAPTSTGVKTTISLPPLYECEFATWTYTAPVGPKYLGIYVTGTQNFLETYSLPSVYDDRQNGTFSWKVDLPAGLSVAAMFYVVADGASGTNGAQASTPDAVINAGSSGADCLGTNDPGSQAQIFSLASSLDPSFSATKSNSAPTSAASAGGGGGGTNTGAIVGGVVGGIVGIALIALLLVYLKREHDAQAGDAYSLYSGRSEKRGSFHQPRYGEGPASTGGLTAPPPGTYYATDDQGNLHLVMGYPPNEGEPAYVPPPPEPAVSEALLSPAPLRTAPVGTLPEPMDESAPPKTTTPAGAPGSPFRGATPPASPAPTSHPFTPVTERNGFLAHQGLDDPSTFSPARSQH
ncbi:hypothetical protein JCM10296v2_000931 [Rhodotorula toruloides]